MLLEVVLLHGPVTKFDLCEDRCAGIQISCKPLSIRVLHDMAELNKNPGSPELLQYDPQGFNSSLSRILRNVF
jgi:hypothetical protein